MLHRMEKMQLNHMNEDEYNIEKNELIDSLKKCQAKEK